MLPFKLDQFERSVLYLLCRAGKAHSSVTLASDLYEHTIDVQVDRVFEWWAVEQLLEDLNKMGLVVYRLDRGESGKSNAGLIVNVRPTRMAYEVMKMPWSWTTVVNQRPGRGMDPPQHPNDPTDFRTHGETAKGSKIECCSIIDHVYLYAEHADKHRDQLIELFGTDQI